VPSHPRILCGDRCEPPRLRLRGSLSVCFLCTGGSLSNVPAVCVGSAGQRTDGNGLSSSGTFAVAVNAWGRTARRDTRVDCMAAALTPRSRCGEKIVWTGQVQRSSPMTVWCLLRPSWGVETHGRRVLRKDRDGSSAARTVSSCRYVLAAIEN
jgi:hypothetical protein